jgi:serine/threonine protein kinase
MKVIAPNGFEDECIIATIMHETVKGLEYLHARPLIHRLVHPFDFL